jgi:hypothetical protein
MKTIPSLLLILALVQVTAAANDRSTYSTDRTPEGLQSSDWKSIRSAHEAWKHEFRQIDGVWQAHNPGQQWTATFDGRGFLASPKSADWNWGLELRSFGHGSAQTDVKGEAEASASGKRLSYRWQGGLEEWFVNDSRGLEQGWTIASRSVGAPGPSEPLTLTLDVRGNLTPRISSDATGVSFHTTSGASALTYDGLKAWDADGKILPARFEATGKRTIRIAVDETGARYPITIDPIAQQAYLKASNTGAGDAFGFSVAVSGDTVIVGAYGEDSGATGVNGNQTSSSAVDSGAAYVFTRSGATWTQQAYMKASNTGAEDYFGISVAISDDTAIVGAYAEASGAIGINGNQADNSANYAGAVYVFTRSGSVWSQQAYLKASNAGAVDNFGYSVAISGDTVVVGAEGEASAATGINGNQADNSAYQAGAAYIFIRSGATWSQQAYLKASNSEYNDRFGWSVGISNNTVVVGAFDESSNATGVNGNQTNNNAARSGAAYVFTRSGSTWSQQAYLKASNTGAGDWFGTSVAVEGDTIVVGASDEASNATGVNGNQADNSNVATGAAYVFTRSGTTWSQQAYLKAGYNGFSMRFGTSVAVEGDTVVVGAWGEDSNATGVNGNQANVNALDSGAAYVFSRSGTTWSQQASLKASNTGAGDRFGTSVAISGYAVIVGAYNEDSNATGGNGVETDNSAGNSGASYVFDLNAALPAPEIAIQQAGADIANGATRDFGPAVVGSTSDFNFSIFNTGSIDLNLIGAPKVAVGGSPDFTVIAQPASPIAGPGGSSDFTVRFTPTGSGTKAASLTISNNDGDENLFVIQINGTALSFTTDTDNDGLNDGSEFNMSALGFDWQVSQPALVATLNNGANDAGFYTAAQVQALHVGTPLLQRDPLSGEFTLTIGVKKSLDLLEFDPFPVTAPQISINSAGEMEVRFTSPDNAAFFRVGAE